MKPWYASKTIWVGVATIALAGVSALTSGGTWKDAALAIVGAANLWLRTQTVEPLIKEDRRDKPTE